MRIETADLFTSHIENSKFEELENQKNNPSLGLEKFDVNKFSEN